MSLYWCSLGDHPMRDDEPRYQKVEGWEKPGRGLHGKSGSSLVLREAKQEFACRDHIVKRQNGIDPDQPTL